MNATTDYADFSQLYKTICRFDRFLGLELEVLQPGKIIYRLAVVENHLSMPPACHGGVIAAMMDSTLGVTALSWAVAQGKLCATVEFKTHFFSQVKEGDRLQGTGEIDFTGSSLVVPTAEIMDITTNRLVAKGMGTFTLYPITKKKELLELLAKGKADDQLQQDNPLKT
ncbi:MAG: PaaI family thioesterase [Gammaproteobacteria bacterium]|nr:PaaI family thioesterase [Gammaproteobacteria bacterium]